MFMMNKLIFSISIFIGTLISISSYSWMGMWMGLEINLLSIIPLLANSKNMLNNEASLKYFIVQALASTLLLFSIIMMTSNLLMTWESNLMLIFNSSLLTKMGTAPFHFWFPEVIEGLNWLNCLLLLTWQKLAPMILIMYNNKMIMFFSFIIIFSMLISGILGINQISIRKILAYSSINHMGWMLSSMFFMESIWMVYFLIYSLISMNIIFMLKIFNIFFLKQLFTELNNKINLKMFFIMNFISLAGMPPFLGFMPKWLTIQSLIENGLMFLPLLMVITTLLTIYFYTRVALSTIILNSNMINFFFMNNKPHFLMVLFNFTMLMSLIIITLIFNIY
uniref:NADH-ubiquinone oxidoreductase chain 2 n=1 Tax=Ochthebius colveranus TaxID=723409 RepID=A0A7H0DLA0_9COLE|nr:NADH dehydrogenase subunit 2 [Ochthebius colveranus]